MCRCPSPRPSPRKRGEGVSRRSSALAWSQRRSISARVDCEGVRPSAASSSSMRWKRRTNLALAARRAVSGSILRWRATLAITNSRSPNSSVTASLAAPSGWRPSAIASSSSAISSLALANTGASEGQSKPTLAALCCNLTARVRAGKPTGTSSSTPGPPTPTLPGICDAPSARWGGEPRSGFAAIFSAALMRSQKPGAAPAARSAAVPNTCGWRRIILVVMASTTSAKAKACRSSAMRA